MSNSVRAILPHLLELGRILLWRDDDALFLAEEDGGDDDLRERWKQELVNAFGAECCRGCFSDVCQVSQCVEPL